jgi:hypothetical protein
MKRLLKTGNKSQTVSYLLVCVCMVVIFTLALVYPYSISLGNINHEIKEIRSKIKEQKTLHPFYQDLEKIVIVRPPDGLAFPPTASLAPDETDAVSKFFQQIAEENRMILKDIAPDVDSLISGSGRVTMKVVARGDFFHIRDFLLQTGEIPYVKRVERIQIEKLDGLPELELRLNVIISQQARDS